MSTCVFLNISMNRLAVNNADRIIEEDFGSLEFSFLLPLILGQVNNNYTSI